MITIHISTCPPPTYVGEYGLVEIKIPSASERVNRIVMFMENYRQRKDVQKMAIDALIMYAKNRKCDMCMIIYVYLCSCDCMCMIVYV